MVFSVLVASWGSTSSETRPSTPLLSWLTDSRRSQAPADVLDHQRLVDLQRRLLLGGQLLQRLFVVAGGDDRLLEDGRVRGQSADALFDQVAERARAQEPPAHVVVPDALSHLVGLMQGCRRLRAGHGSDLLLLTSVVRRRSRRGSLRSPARRSAPPGWRGARLRTASPTRCRRWRSPRPRHQPLAQTEDVGVVVRARLLRALDVPGVDRAHASNLVGGDANPEPGAADEQPEGAGVVTHGARHRRRERRVVAGGVGLRSQIFDRVSAPAQVIDQPSAQGESRVIAAGVNFAHDLTLILQSGAEGAPKTPSPRRTSPWRPAPPSQARSRSPPSSFSPSSMARRNRPGSRPS